MTRTPRDNTRSSTSYSYWAFIAEFVWPSSLTRTMTSRDGSTLYPAFGAFFNDPTEAEHGKRANIFQCYNGITGALPVRDWQNVLTPTPCGK